MNNIKRFMGVLSVAVVATVGLRCTGDTIINLTEPEDDGTQAGQQPPAGPTDLQLTVISPSSVRLSWTDNSSDELGFRVMRGGASENVNTVAATVAEESKSYVDTGLESSTTYHYQVFAFSAAGNSSSYATGSATTSAPPEMNLSASEATFTAAAGGSNPSSQTLSVTNSGGGTLTGLTSSIGYGAGQPTGWLSAVLNQTTAPATMTLQGTTGGLTPGSYFATVAVNSADAANSPQSVNVAFNVTSSIGSPEIVLSAVTVTFVAQTGGVGPASQSTMLTNGGSGTLTGLATTVAYGVGEPIDWLSTTLSGTAAPATLTLQATTIALSAGVYHATVSVTSAVAANSPQSVDVTLTVSSEPLIGLSASSLMFDAQQGGADPASQTVTVSNVGSGTLSNLDRTIAYGGGQPTGWLTASLNSATAPATLTLQASTGVLGVGSYTATVDVTSGDAGNSPQVISVTFDVSAAPGPTSLRIVNDLSSEVLQGFDWSLLNRTVTLQVHASLDSIYAGNGVHQLLYGWDQTDNAANTLSLHPGTFQDFDVSSLGLVAEYYVLIWAGYWEYDAGSGYWNKTYSSILDCDGQAGAANKWSIIRIIQPYGQPEIINLSWVLPQTHWQNSGLCP